MAPDRDEIVFVDDNSQVLRALQREMEPLLQQEGLTLRTFSNPLECLEALEKSADRTSVVVADLRMPQMSGEEFLLQVRESYPSIELILLTAYQDFPAIQKAVSAALRALVFKPWDPDHLLSEICKARDIQTLRQKKEAYLAEVQKQLSIAGEFQKKLLGDPPFDPHTPDITPQPFALNFTYQPLPEMAVGSDYYDFLPLGGDRILALIGDVTGYGIKPAFITAILKVLSQSPPLRRLSQEKDPSRFLRGLNQELFRVLGNNQEVLITFLAIILDSKNESVHYASAGHLPLYLVRQDSCRPLSSSGPPLGSTPQFAYQSSCTDLVDGDIVTAFTDGIFQGKGNHIKTSDPLIERTLVQARHGENFNEAFLGTIKTLRTLSHFHDDVTMASFHFTKESHSYPRN